MPHKRLNSIAKCHINAISLLIRLPRIEHDTRLIYDRMNSFWNWHLQTIDESDGNTLLISLEARHIYTYSRVTPYGWESPKKTEHYSSHTHTHSILFRLRISYEMKDVMRSPYIRRRHRRILWICHDSSSHSSYWMWSEECESISHTTANQTQFFFKIRWKIDFLIHLRSCSPWLSGGWSFY